MTLQDMIDAINRRLDEVVDVADAVEWLNAGKNQMAIAVGAKFPDLVVGQMQSSFVFDERYHEAPVLYACARYKERDSSTSEAGNFMVQFEQLKREFVLEYEVPPRYREDRFSQQFVAEDGQTTFTITKNGYDPQYGDLKVYINDVLYEDVNVYTDKTFMILNKTINAGDAITAVWEEHTYLQEPPFNWWRW